MDTIVLLILAAVWAAVFIPPLLRSRIENRTSESVSDFRRQLNKLQTAVPNRAGQMSMARPLAGSPLQRPAAPGRPGQPGGRRHGTSRNQRTLRAAPNERVPVRERSAGGRGRTHGTAREYNQRQIPGRGGNDPRRGDPRRGDARRRPDGRFDRPEPGRTPPRGRRRPADDRAPAQRRHAAGRDERAHRQTHVHRDTSQHDLNHRRRSNVLMMLVVLTGATLFIAAQTRSTTVVYLFVLSFIALCGYMFMLSQAKQREASDWGNDWIS